MARGSIVKRGRNYHVVYRIGGRQKWEVAGPRKRDAERLLEQRMSAISAGIYREIRKTTFSEFAERWLDQYATGHVKDSTLRSYGSVIRTHLEPVFGSREIGGIAPLECQALIASKLKEGRIRPKTVTNIVVVMKMMFKYAVRWGYLPENPAHFVERPRVERKEMDYLQPHEVQLLLKHADPRYRLVFFTAIMTGMRRGEVLAIRWADIDWANATIHVRRALDGAKFVTPKSRRSVRGIVVSPRLAKALREHWITRKENGYDLVFTNREGHPIDAANMVRREFLPALRRAGLRKIRFHDLRHTYVAMMISQGENLKFIQSQLGHASIQTTLDRYGHLLPEVSHGTGERLDNTVFGKSVSKVLAKPLSEDSPRKEKAPEPVTAQGLSLVAGARSAHQKRTFPPVDVIDIQFEYQGSALVPIGA